MSACGNFVSDIVEFENDSLSLERSNQCSELVIGK